MKTAASRFLAAALCFALLLAGCGGPDLRSYPQVEPSVKTTAPRTVTLDVHREADPLTEDTVNQLAAALLDVSGGAVTLEVVCSENPAAALENGSAQLALLTNRDILEAEPGLSFLDWPFFWDSPEQWLTVMGAEGGLVRGSRSLEESLGGRILGVWYGGRVSLLCRGTFYDEIAFSGAGFGAMAGAGGSGFFGDIGEDLQAEEVVAGEPEELDELLAAGEIRFLERPLLEVDPDDLPEALKSIEDTGHRYQGCWLVLGRDFLTPELEPLLKAAAAYLPEQAFTDRRRAEEERLLELEEAGLKVRREEHYTLERAAREYFRRTREELGCSDKVWEELGVFLGY